MESLIQRRSAAQASRLARTFRSCVVPAAVIAFSPLVLFRRSVARSLDMLVPLVVAEVLSRVDLTALITERVDLDQVVAKVDLDAAVTRVDLDAVVDHLNLVGLVEEILDAVDLPAIIRESTGVMMSDSVWRARMCAVAADNAVARLRDRLSRRTTVRRP